MRNVFEIARVVVPVLSVLFCAVYVLMNAIISSVTPGRILFKQTKQINIHAKFLSISHQIRCTKEVVPNLMCLCMVKMFPSIDKYLERCFGVLRVGRNDRFYECRQLQLYVKKFGKKYSK